MTEKKSNLRYYILEYYKLKWGNKDLTWREVLYRFYVEEDLGINKMAKKMRCSHDFIQKELKANGIVKEVKWKQ